MTGAVPRRRWRASAAVLAAAVVATALAGCDTLSTSPVEEREFANPLAIPPLAPSTVQEGVRTFHLTAQRGTTEFPGIGEAETWGFDGSFLGPTLRASRGERVAVEVGNALDQPTSVHWHGMHLPAAMDGGPHQAVAPGETWRPTWTIDQPAATLWYHPHPHGATEEHVYRGLAGMFVLDDDASLAADLPSAYGVDDLPLIVQDKRFDDEGALVLDRDGSEPGMLGDTILVNGTPGAYRDVTTERVRLRLLNGSTARTYTFAFADRPMTMIAGDGGLLDEPLERDRLRLAPGERAEVVVAFQPGERVRLRSEKTDLGGIVVPATSGGNDAFDVMEFRAADSLAPVPPPSWPESAEAVADELHEADAGTTRSFVLNTREINGEEMDMSRIDEVVYVGDTEIWEVTSTQPIPHSFHIHDVQFRVLSVGGHAPPPELAGRKDTIYLNPNTTYRLLLRFEDYADPAMPYMYHCHMLLHEDEGMMGQFVVIERGDEARVRAPDGAVPSGGAGGHGGHH
ncbi:multicopper oxidase family protein [Microbacterium resistens]|uniref:multicopper oxidase family protein n=1 Tax=Microbacterium resistens TaxID=156977 RepID=UPI000835B834|nr:multicopper oxidase domain-containing protein [Microbacterium resistens]